jgi:hypothetical protein
MSPLETLDASLTEHLRLALVAGDYLPDITTFTDDDAYLAACVAYQGREKQGTKPLIQLANTFSFEGLNEQRRHCIVINRSRLELSEFSYRAIAILRLTSMPRAGPGAENWPNQISTAWSTTTCVLLPAPKRLSTF